MLKQKLFRYLIVFVLVGTAILLLIDISVFETSYLVSNTNRNKFLRRYNVYDRSKSNRILNPSSLTVVTIATGGYDAEQLIESLHNVGGWSNILVIADDCHSPPNRKYANVSFVPRTNDAMSSKLLKTTVFQHAKSEFVLYIDADIIVQKPLDTFLRNLEATVFSLSVSQNTANSCAAYMQIYPLFPLIPYRYSFTKQAEPYVISVDPKFSVWNSGLILLHQNRSKLFLQEWGKLIATGDYKMDQWALRQLLKTHAGDSNFNVCPLPEDMLFPASLAGKINKHVYEYTFNHETSSNKAKEGIVCHPT